MRFRLSIFAVCLAVAACSNASEHFVSVLPGDRLMTYAGVPGPALTSCPTEKCLTVLVAPWCQICHGAVPEIVSLRRWLDERGVASRVVVGASGDLGQIKEFAKEFGPDTLLDPEQVLRSRSVPFFLVSDRQGHVLKFLAGVPRQGGAEGLANMLGLM